jgi:flagellar biosynthesis/type III secretory pathway chaperone
MANHVEQLIKTLQQELEYQRELAAVLDNKLDAMRHYDLSRLEALTQNEHRIVEEIRQNEYRRTDAVRRATRQYWPGRRQQPASCKELAQVSEEPERSKLITLAAMLAEIAETVQRLNRIGGIASRKILTHFDHIFQIIAQSGRDIGLYERGGKRSLLEQNRLVDALA